MAIEANDAPAIHDTLNEVIALHAILVGCAVRKMREGCFSEHMVFKFPEIIQIKTDLITDGPVVSFAFDEVSKRAALRMALDAGVVGVNVIHACGIEDIAARGMGDVFAAWTMAAFAANVPFRDLLGANVVAH